MPLLLVKSVDLGDLRLRYLLTIAPIFDPLVSLGLQIFYLKRRANHVIHSADASRAICILLYITGLLVDKRCIAK
jgi:hypothetical protein